MDSKKTPIIGKNVYIAEGAIVRGDVVLEEDSSVWFHATIRAEEAQARIGAGSNIQDNCVIHVDFGAPVTVGKNVTVGHSAVLHGCTIQDHSLIGMGAIILNHAVIGKNCIVGAGALVTQNTVIPDNSLVLGSPGKVMRTVTLEEIDDIRKNAAYYRKEAAAYAAAEH